MESPRENVKNTTESIIPDIIKKISVAENVGQVELPPLNNKLDTEALERLFQNTEAPLSVTFEYRNWVVEVENEGGVELSRIVDDG